MPPAAYSSFLNRPSHVQQSEEVLTAARGFYAPITDRRTFGGLMGWSGCVVQIAVAFGISRLPRIEEPQVAPEGMPYRQSRSIDHFLTPTMNTERLQLAVPLAASIALPRIQVASVSFESTQLLLTFAIHLAHLQIFQ